MNQWRTYGFVLIISHFAISTTVQVFSVLYCNTLLQVREVECSIKLVSVRVGVTQDVHATRPRGHPEKCGRAAHARKHGPV